jgi:hypothetical protein
MDVALLPGLTVGFVYSPGTQLAFEFTCRKRKTNTIIHFQLPTLFPGHIRKCISAGENIWTLERWDKKNLLSQPSAVF